MKQTGQLTCNKDVAERRKVALPKIKKIVDKLLNQYNEWDVLIVVERAIFGRVRTKGI